MRTAASLLVIASLGLVSCSDLLGGDERAPAYVVMAELRVGHSGETTEVRLRVLTADSLRVPYTPVTFEPRSGTARYGSSVTNRDGEVVFTWQLAEQTQNERQWFVARAGDAELEGSVPVIGSGN